jgi:hypothetical protein
MICHVGLLSYRAENSKECRREVSVDGRTPSFFARIFQRAGLAACCANDLAIAASMPP